MKTRLLLFFGLLSISIHAQETTGFEVPNFAPKTPEAAAFLKYGEYPVDLSTGVPNISIPLYTIEDHGFSIPITLDYHASGVKVNQEATWVGLGWNLNFGAQIILSARDGIDQNNEHIDDIPDADAVHAYYANHPYNFTGGPIVTQFLDASRIKDVYNFSSPTANGSFYIRDKDSMDVVIFPPEAFKVEIFNSSTQYLRFKITDTKGNIYFFDNTAEKSVRTMTHNDFYYSAWFVDEIKTSDNNLISFTYQDDGQMQDHQTSQRVAVSDKGSMCGCPGYAEYRNTVSEVITEGGTTYTNAKKIKEILFNGGKSKVAFVKTDGRQDLIINGMQLTNDNGFLDRIEVQQYENSNFVTKKGYDLEYSYFNNDATGIDAYKFKRLKLDKILTLIDGDAHEFIYSDIALPSKKAIATDYFGYFNNHPSLDMIPKHFIPPPYNVEVGHANRAVNPEVIEAGILKEIHYPSKGWTKFDYEANQYYGVDKFGKYNLNVISHNMVQGTGVPMAAASTVMGEGIDGPICLNPGPECVHYETIPITFNNSTGIMSFTIINDSQNHHYEYAKVQMFVNGILRNTATSTSLAGSPTGTSYTYQFVDISGSGSINFEAYGSGMKISDFQIRYINNDLTSKNVNAAGVRIRQIENFNHDNNPISIKQYDYSNPQYTQHTSGKLVNETVVSFVTNPFTNNAIVTCSCTLPPCAGNPGTNYSVSYNITSDSRYGIEGNSVIYEYVKEKNASLIDSLSSNGYTSYKFSTDSDYLPWGDSSVQIYTSWKRGKALEKKVYKTSANVDLLVSEEINSYIDDISKVSFIDGFKMFRHGSINVAENPSSPLIPPYTYGLLYGTCTVPTDVMMTIEPANLHFPVAWFYLKSTEIREHFYDSSNIETGIVTTTKTFNYNNPQHQQLSSQVTSNSHDETVETKYYYPQDSAMSGEPHISDLIAKNMIAVPLEIQSYNGSEKLAEKKTVYADDTSSNNLLLPKFVYTKKGTDSNATLEKEITYDKYDTDGRILQYTIEDGNTVCLIWGYNNTYPVAKIENAPYSAISGALIDGIKNASGSGGTEANLLNALANLRSAGALADAMVTTYTYIPLFGVSTVTDPKGITAYYGYDTEGRLITVKDSKGNILSENQYHFKN